MKFGWGCSRVLLALALGSMIAACGDGDDSDSETTLLRVDAELDAPVDRGRVVVSDLNGTVLQESEPEAFRQGSFAIGLGREARRELERSGVLQLAVVVETGLSAEPTRTLRRIIDDFEPDAHVAHINVLSTIAARYVAIQRGRGSSQSIAELSAEAAAGLGADAPVVGGRVAPDAFDPAIFLDAAVAGSGFDPLVELTANQLASGSPGTLSFGGAALGGLGADVFAFVGKNIASGAIQGPVSHAFGFVLDLISGPDQNTRTINDIKDIVQQNHDQLTQLRAAVGQVSQQVDDLRDELGDLIRGTSYAQRASDLQKEINTLVDLHDQLVWLAKAYDPTDTSFATKNKQFIDTLLTGIQTNAHKVLLDIQTTLLGTSSVQGLISLWADINKKNTGYPYFYSNAFLKKAVPHVQYYIGAQTLAFSLLAEYSHHLEPSLGQQVFLGALRDYYSAVDLELRALSDNRLMKWKIPGIGTDFGYPTAILPDDNLLLDTTYGTSDIPTYVWTRGPICLLDPPKIPQPCGAYVQSADAQVAGVPRIQDYLATYALGGLSGWALPTAARMQVVTQCAHAEFAEPSVVESMIAAGFALPKDTLGYWTNDVFTHFTNGASAPEGARKQWALESFTAVIPGSEVFKGAVARGLGVAELADTQAVAWLYRPQCVPSDLCKASNSCQWCPPDSGHLPATTPCTP